MTKAIDCVELKRRIQEQILAEVSGLSTEERTQRESRLIDSDPELARIWRSARPITPNGKTPRVSRQV